MEQKTGQGSIPAGLPESRFDIINDGLPLECPDPVCMERNDIDRIMTTLWADLQQMEAHAMAANRYSENYRIAGRGLEKMLRKMGSLILTNAVFEQQGYRAELPEELTLERLACTANYHFNKTHAAVAGIQMKNPKLYAAMLVQEIRWASLLERLEATEEKIIRIRAGKSVQIIRQKHDPAGPAEKAGSGLSADALNAPVPSALPILYDLFPENREAPAVPAEDMGVPCEAENDRDLSAGMPETGAAEILPAAEAVPGFARDLCEKLMAADESDPESFWDSFLRNEGADSLPDMTAFRRRCPYPSGLPPDEDLPGYICETAADE